jgi:hypothetical protein
MNNNDDLCKCGHARSEHCLDDECCVFNKDEWGGACLIYKCFCGAFETPKEIMKDFKKVTNLQERIKAGEKFEFELFWKGPFSQWANQGFTVDDVFYKTAEHWMMVEKARLFGDEDTIQKILEADYPKIAKDLGRQVKNYDEEVWIEHRYNIVLSGNRYKFTQNNEYKAILLGTGSKILVEASPVDRIWGIGLAEDDKAAKDPLMWKGLNLLGFVLTDLREELKHA